MTNTFKQRIIEALREQRRNFGGSDAQYAVSLDINPAQLSRMLKGELDRVISQQKLEHVAQVLGVTDSPWKAARTQVLAYIHAQLEACQQNGLCAILVDRAGIGKTFAAQLYKRTHQNVIYIDCSQAKTKRRLMKAIARQLGIDEVEAEVLPDQKSAVVQRHKAAGEVVAMAGDGVNDAPALAAADIGVAMGAAGSAVAVESADIALMSDDLLKLPEAIDLAKRTNRVMKQNIFIALLTVAVLLAGVFAGGVTMAIGMLVHELSVLVVIVNAMRLLRRRKFAGGTSTQAASSSPEPRSPARVS